MPQSTNDVAALSAELNKQVVATLEGRDVTRGELATAFDWVVNPEGWKLPIDVTVVLSPRQQALAKAAVEFFTASVPTFEPLFDKGHDKNVVRVRAAGYYATVGA